MGNSEKRHTMNDENGWYELFWSDDEDYPKAYDLYSMYGNQFKNFTYRVRKIDYPLYGDPSLHTISNKYPNVLIPNISDSLKIKSIGIKTKI